MASSDEKQDPDGDTSTVDGEETSLISKKGKKTRRYKLPKIPKRWPLYITIGIFAVGILAFVIYPSELVNEPSSSEPLPIVSVAFIGDSMIFQNDLPRFLQLLSMGQLQQNSCLHANATLTDILINGNGMYERFDTSNALDRNGYHEFGACTVKQLLLGHDDELELVALNRSNTLPPENSTNPCFRNYSYLTYLDTHVFSDPPHWDFVVLNDYTGNPGLPWAREASLHALNETYIPMFLATGATPIFFDTQAYWTDLRNMTAYVDIPTFTAMTYEGYKLYSQLVARHLPASQAPRIACVGIVFLVIWEENRRVWNTLFHGFDHIHASPAGSLLTGLVFFHTIYGRMPDRSVVFQSRKMSVLWSHARVMQQADQPPDPFPSFDEAEYLYDVVDRVMHQGFFPTSMAKYLKKSRKIGSPVF